MNDVNFYRPTNITLKKYIEGFYFLNEDINSGPIKYYTFPNNYCILTINRNFKVQSSKNVVTLEKSDTQNILTSLVSRYTQPIEVNYKNLVDEITIYFKPLGIHHFIKNNSNLFKLNTHIDFLFSQDFNDNISNIFDLDEKEKISQLETYLLTLFKEDNLHLIYQILFDLDNNLKIEDIALKYNFTRQYINKLFLTYVGKSPSEYRKINRFRKSLKLSPKSNNFKDLYIHGFYDQSHFIRNFKEFTNYNPSKFFKNVDTEKENIWLFI